MPWDSNRLGERDVVPSGCRFEPRGTGSLEGGGALRRQFMEQSGTSGTRLDAVAFDFDGGPTGRAE